MRFFSLLLLFCWVACTQNTPVPSNPPAAGGDQDEHGCKGSAGYTWSALRNECIRLFESGIRLHAEAKSLDTTMSAFVVFPQDGSDAKAEVYLPGYPKGFMLTKITQEGAGSWTGDTLTLNYWKGMYMLEGKSGVVLYQGGEQTASPERSHTEGLLQGRWQSVDDAKSLIEIEGGRLTNIYGGKKLDDREFAYVADCKTNACPGAASDHGCFTSAGKMDIECFSIVSISEKMLELTLAGGAGKTLRYKKTK
jgi:hypothetical protein